MHEGYDTYSSSIPCLHVPPARGADPPLGSDSARGLSSSAFTLPQLVDQTRLAFSSRRSNLADTHNAPRVLRGKLFHLSCLSTCLTFCFTFGIVIYQPINNFQQLTCTNKNTKFWVEISRDCVNGIVPTEMNYIWWTIHRHSTNFMLYIIIAINGVQIMYRPTYKVCLSPHQVQTTSLLKLTIRVHMSCPRDISCKMRSSTRSWSANCRGRLGFLFTRTQNCWVCPSSRVESYYFGRAKKAGQILVWGQEALSVDIRRGFHKMDKLGSMFLQTQMIFKCFDMRAKVAIWMIIWVTDHLNDSILARVYVLNLNCAIQVMVRSCFPNTHLSNHAAKLLYEWLDL